MKAKDPYCYNSLVDKHDTSKCVQKPAVKKHLHRMGFTAVDGTVYPTREEQIEANRINRLYKEREEKLRKLHVREQSHLRHLSKAARAGEVMFTKDGVFESSPCEECDIYHQVASPLTTNTNPSSSLGKRQVEEQERGPKVSYILNNISSPSKRLLRPVINKRLTAPLRDFHVL